MSSIDTFRDMIERRLPNWARWRWQDLHSAGPDGYTLQCVGIMRQVKDDERAGWGEFVEGNTARVAYPDDVRGEIEIDEEDAINMHGMIQQIGQEHRASLHRAFVLHAHVPPGAVAAAIRAMKANSDENRRVVARMR